MSQELETPNGMTQVRNCPNLQIKAKICLQGFCNSDVVEVYPDIQFGIIPGMLECIQNVTDEQEGWVSLIIMALSFL